MFKFLLPDRQHFRSLTSGLISLLARQTPSPINSQHPKLVNVTLNKFLNKLKKGRKAVSKEGTIADCRLQTLPGRIFSLEVKLPQL